MITVKENFQSLDLFPIEFKPHTQSFLGDGATLIVKNPLNFWFYFNSTKYVS